LKELYLYFLDIDLRTSRFYLIPFKQDKDSPFLISVKARYLADNLLRKLNAGLIPSPPDSKFYCLKEEIFLKNLRLQHYEYIAQ